MRTGTDSGTWCTLPQSTVKGNRWQRTTIPFKYWVVFCVQCILELAGETHHHGATYRLLSLPKAHTFARLLCRKTSLLPEVTMGNASASAHAGSLWLTVVRGGGAQICPLLRNVGCSLLIEWWVVRAEGPWWRRRRSIFNALETSVLFWFFIARNFSRERNRQAGQVRQHSDRDGESWLLCIC